MSRTVIEPPEAGDGCAICWGSGKAFGDVVTPSTILLKLSGIQKGILWTASDGEPPNGIIQLTQVSPCKFAMDNGFLEIYWDWRSTFTFCHGLQNHRGLFTFAQYDTCLVAGDNQEVSPNSYFYLGSAEVML